MHIPIQLSHHQLYPTDIIQTRRILSEKLVNMSIFRCGDILTQIGWDDSIMEECKFAVVSLLAELVGEIFFFLKMVIHTVR